jgi:hypothetical protein
VVEWQTKRDEREDGIRPGTALQARHKSLDFYPEDNVEVETDFKQGSDMIKSTFYKDCY